jgi:hypothetical protein
MRSALLRHKIAGFFRSLLGGSMSSHDCTYMASLVGKHIPPKLMRRQDEELRYRPWAGDDTVQTADILDIIAEAPIGSRMQLLSPRTSPEIMTTLHWIQNTLMDNEGETLHFDKDGKDYTQVNLLQDVNGCQVAFVYMTQSNLKQTSHSRQQVNLADLDPTSLKVHTGEHDVGGPVSVVTVYTTDKAPTVFLNINDWSWEASTTLPSTNLMWELPAPYADRFVKALHQAIALCGGKPSSF